MEEFLLDLSHGYVLIAHGYLEMDDPDSAEMYLEMADELIELVEMYQEYTQQPDNEY